MEHVSRRSMMKFGAVGLVAGAGLIDASSAGAATSPSVVVVTNIKANTENDGGHFPDVRVDIGNRTPVFFSTGGVNFYKPDSTVSVDLLVVKLLIASKAAVFDYAYGTKSSDWSLPDGNSGKAKLSDGSSAYVYEFVYEGPRLMGQSLVASPDHCFQVVSGGNSLLGSSFGSQIEAVVNGKRQNRSSDTAVIVRSSYSQNLVVGDAGIL